MKLENGQKIKKYLFDIKNSIDSIFEFLGEERNFFKYQENKMLKRAVERELEIIGEAMNNILKINQNIQIENARKIVDLRNRVIHAYNSIVDEIIWGIVVNQLPKLKIEIEKLLA